MSKKVEASYSTDGAKEAQSEEVRRFLRRAKWFATLLGALNIGSALLQGNSVMVSLLVPLYGLVGIFVNPLGVRVLVYSVIMLTVYVLFTRVSEARSEQARIALIILLFPYGLGLTRRMFRNYCRSQLTIADAQTRRV